VTGVSVYDSRRGRTWIIYLVVHGSRDCTPRSRAAQLTSRWVTGLFDVKVLEGVSHWIPEQVPDKLAACRRRPDRRVAEVDKLSMGMPLDPSRHWQVRIK
jgi:hypothetical protein